MEKHIKNSPWESLWYNSRIRYRGKTLDFPTWSSLGIALPKHLEEANTRLTFTTIKHRHKLADIELYNFLKIRTALTKADLGSHEPSMLRYMANINKIGHQISHLYKLLRPSDTKINDKANTEWGLLSEGLRHQTLISASRHKITPVLAQTKFWLLHRVFWTPARLVSMGLTDSDSCWNCHKHKGDLPHLILHCPKVKVFWAKVLGCIREILGCAITLESQTLPSVFMTADLNSQQDRDLQDLLLVAAVKLILSNWKCTNKATFKGWLNWITFLRGADNTALGVSLDKQSSRGMWQALDDFLSTHKPP